MTGYIKLLVYVMKDVRVFHLCVQTESVCLTLTVRIKSTDIYIVLQCHYFVCVRF